MPQGEAVPASKPAGSACPDLVSVIVPAFNAVRTIDETLASARAQTYAALEIIVVDDGSTDGTVGVVQAHLNADPRVRLIRQSNQGVAAARNAGIAAATGALVATLDADDLWLPEKIRMQVEAMRRVGDGAGLCCTGVHAIDGVGRGVGRHLPEPGSAPMRAMCRVNLVGNGSSALMPRSLVLECGGFDPSLRAANAQGCEDWQLYLRIVEHHTVVVVPECLTGYRQHPMQMSGRLEEMVRSAVMVLERVRKRRPDLAADIDEGLRGMRRRASGAALSAGEYGRALQLSRSNGLAAQFDVAARSLRHAAGRLVRRWRSAQVAPNRPQYFIEAASRGAAQATNTSIDPWRRSMGKIAEVQAGEASAQFRQGEARDP